MKNHIQNNINKVKKGENAIPSRKRGSFSQVEGVNDNRKKINSSPQKITDNKKDLYKYDKNNNISNLQQISDIKENNKKFNNNNIKTGNNFIQNNNYINNNNKKNNEEIKERKKTENTQLIQNKDNINNNIINIKDNKDNKDKENKENTDFKEDNKINIINKEIPKDTKKDIKETISPNQLPVVPSNDDNFYNQLKESDKKLRDSLQAYNNINKKGDGTSLNTLFKLRSILINWLKDSDQDLEYTKFMTEKKLKYLMKNKEKSETRIKVLDSELKAINTRKEELEKILGEIYCFYDEEGLKDDIKRFENSNEVKSGKFSKTLEQLETMKKMLPYVTEYGKIKDSKAKKYNEKKELEKIVKSSGQTLVFLNNYYKNIKKKINEQINNNN
jgi:hypothetical protein